MPTSRITWRWGRPRTCTSSSRARRTKTVIPAKAGIHGAKQDGLWNMGPRLRGDDRQCLTAKSPRLDHIEFRIEAHRLAVAARHRHDVGVLVLHGLEERLG